MSAIARRSGYVLAAACLLAGGVTVLVLAAYGPGGPLGAAVKGGLDTVRQAGPAVPGDAVGQPGLPVPGDDSGSKDDPPPEVMAAIAAAPEPGEPRSWEGGLPMATYSVVNLRNGNCLTVIPVVSWSGLGPTLDMTLYHNSATVGDDQALLTRGMGFTLGPGWTTSYSGHVYVDPGDPNTAIVFEDDGTRNEFTKSGDEWVASVGVFDVLDETTNGWKLTRSDQSYREFTDFGTSGAYDGLLTAEVDSSGNRLEISRALQADGYRIVEVTDAAGRPLEFDYSGYGTGPDYELVLRDPVDKLASGQDDPNAVERVWHLVRDASGWMQSAWIDQDRRYENAFNYDGAGRLTSVSDYDGHAYTYQYAAADQYRLQRVTDPTPVGGGDPLYQELAYVTVPPRDDTITTLTDRRGYDWTFRFLVDGRLKQTTNPLNKTRWFTWDANRNLGTYKDPALNVWTLTWDDRGNLTSVSEPGGHNVRYWTYDQYNTVTSFTDGLGNVTRFEYNDPVIGPYGTDPTLLIKVIEPPDGQGNPAADIDLAYYYAGDKPEWNGLLAAVTHDPDFGITTNGATPVTTEFEYDDWGQFAGERQGFAEYNVFRRIPMPDTAQMIESDSAGREMYGCTGGSCGGAGFDYSWPGSAGGGLRGCGNLGRYQSCSRECQLHICKECDFGLWCCPWWNTDCFPPGCPGGKSLRGGTRSGLLGWPEVHDCDDLSPQSGDGWEAEYMAMGHPVEFNAYGLTDELGTGTRSYKWQDESEQPAYDEFGRPTRFVVSSPGEWGAGVEREFTYYYDDPYGVYGRLDGDGAYTEVLLDPAGQVESVNLINGADEMSVDYFYWPTGRVKYATYSNGTRTYYEYDAGQRLTRMRHELADGSEFFKDISYTYYENGWLWTILEQLGALGGAAPGGEGMGPASGQRWYGTTFTYDNRWRLIREVREGDVGLGTIAFFYDLEYRYDQVGNRTEKIDHLNNVSTAYIYDVEDRTLYGSNSNRLMTYRITDNDTGAFEDVWYYYDVNGNVIRIVRLADGAPQYESTRFVYNGGAMVEYVVGETWTAVEEVEWQYPDGGGSEYALTPELMTWDAARAYAQSRGGDLAIPYAHLWDWLAATFHPASGTVSYWAGASQDPQAGEPGDGWTFVDGSDVPAGTFYWLDGEPDDGGAGGCPPTCLDHDAGAWVMDADTDGLNDGLEDADGNELRYGIVERPVEAACDPDGGDVLRNQRRIFAWQFRYETARGRYMRRILDPETLAPVTTEWSDYDGDWVVSDFEVVSIPAWSNAPGQGTSPGRNPGTGDSGEDNGGGPEDGSDGGGDSMVQVARPTRHYFGAGHADVDASGDWTDQAIAFGNQIGSTELLIDADGQVVQDWAYTAFGEPADLDGPGGPAIGQSRYGFAGDWGYEANREIGTGGVAFPFLHVGARWYDPETGRFFQRDPIGIMGGINVYDYVSGMPTVFVDPSGLGPSLGGLGKLLDSAGNLWPKNTRDAYGRFGRPMWPRRLLKGSGRLLGRASPWVFCASLGWEIGWGTGKQLRKLEVVSDGVDWFVGAAGMPDPPGFIDPSAFCFVEGTKVLTADGAMAIEDIQVGQLVVTSNSEDMCDAALAISPVTHLIRGRRSDLVEVRIGDEVLLCSPNHRFLVPGRGWTEAAHLRTGDPLLSATGEDVLVKSVEQVKSHAPMRVYNLEVKTLHSYYVGEARVLVHNLKP